MASIPIPSARPRSSLQWAVTGSPRTYAKTAAIPAAGGEFRHSISAELEVGTYLLVFLTSFALGGLRSCLSMFVHLELASEALLVGDARQYARASGFASFDVGIRVFSRS